MHDKAPHSISTFACVPRDAHRCRGAAIGFRFDPSIYVHVHSSSFSRALRLFCEIVATPSAKAVHAEQGEDTPPPMPPGLHILDLPAYLLRAARFFQSLSFVRHAAHLAPYPPCNSGATHRGNAQKRCAAYQSIKAYTLRYSVHPHRSTTVQLQGASQYRAHTHATH